MSSEQGFLDVPGVPKGWKLVAISQINDGEWSIDDWGGAFQWRGDKSSGVYPIIRKIEKPKQYRPFANAEEYVQKRRDGIAVDWKFPSVPGRFFTVVSASSGYVWVAFGNVITMFDWEEAFEKLVFRHIDGSISHFGVEVTGE